MGDDKYILKIENTKKIQITIRFEIE